MAKIDGGEMIGALGPIAGCHISSSDPDDTPRTGGPAGRRDRNRPTELDQPGPGRGRPPCTPMERVPCRDRGPERGSNGGAGLHLAIGIVIAVLFILFDRFSTVFSIKGNFPPIIAAWVPNIIFGAVAYWMYRLAPKYQFPAAVHDCKAAVRWLRLNAIKYNVDPKRIGVTGGSAGGHLAQFLGVTASVPALRGRVSVRGCRESHASEMLALRASERSTSVS